MLTHRITISITRHEHDQLVLAAKSLNVSLKEYVRMMVTGMWPMKYEGKKRRREYEWREVLEFVERCDHTLRLDPEETLSGGMKRGYKREELLLAFKEVNKFYLKGGRRMNDEEKLVYGATFRRKL